CWSRLLSFPIFIRRCAERHGHDDSYFANSKLRAVLTIPAHIQARSDLCAAGDLAGPVSDADLPGPGNQLQSPVRSEPAGYVAATEWHQPCLVSRGICHAAAVPHQQPDFGSTGYADFGVSRLAEWLYPEQVALSRRERGFSVDAVRHVHPV